MVRSPRRRAVRAMRTAISPRLAIRTEENMRAGERWAKPSADRVAGFAYDGTPQCRAGPFAAAGAVCADGGGPIGWGGGGGVLRAAARGAGCVRFGAAGAAAGAVAGAGFVSGGA